MRSVQISIPEPCQENWHEMTATDQGRYCNACAKEVVDFSLMTDRQVLNYFSTLTDEKVCGRALPSQLNTDISIPKDPKKRLFWYWNYIVMLFMFFSKTNTVKAQGGVKRVTEISNTPACKVGETVKSSIRVINGKVTDINGNPVSFATIKIKGTPYGLSADANGAYSIKVNPNDVLVITAGGFKETEILVGAQKIINTYLEKGAAYDLKEIVVYAMGGIRRTNRERDKAFRDARYTIDFQIKDDKSCQPINKAKIIIAKNKTNDHDTVFSDKTGSYTLKDIRYYEGFFIKVGADGYEGNEFTINGNDFNGGKKIREVFLKKTIAVKTLDTVVVSATEYGRTTVKGAMVKGISVKRTGIIDTVKTLFTDPSNLINVYPNPVKRGSSFALALKLKHSGTFHIDIIDASGRILLQKQTNILSKEYMEQVQTDSRWSSGVYYIRVFDNNNKPIGKDSFIVQ